MQYHAAITFRTDMSQKNIDAYTLSISPIDPPETDGHPWRSEGTRNNILLYSGYFPSRRAAIEQVTQFITANHTIWEHDERHLNAGGEPRAHYPIVLTRVMPPGAGARLLARCTSLGIHITSAA